MACAVRLCTCFGSICAAGGLPWGLAGGAGVRAFLFQVEHVDFPQFYAAGSVSEPLAR